MSRIRKSRKRALRWGDGYINERALKDGTIRYQARWSEPGNTGDAVWRSRTFDTLEDAERHLREIGEAKREDRYSPESRLTIRDAVAEYIERCHVAGRWKSNTVATNTVMAKRLVYPRIGALRVSRISHRHVQLWIDGLLADGKSSSATANALSLVSASLRELARMGVLTRNPALDVTIRRTASAQRKVWSRDEARAVLAATAPNPRLSALYLMALTTGMRPGELRALRWRDIDLASGRITCRHTITKDVNQREILGATTKTGRSRIIMMTPELVAALRRWRAAQNEVRLAHRLWNDLDFVFDAGDGRFTPAASWQKQHREVVAAAKVEHIPPHAMRHTAATLMLEQDTHPKVVSEILGHATIGMTLDLYSHVSADLQKAAAENLSRQLLDEASSATTSSGDVATDDQSHA